MFKLSDLDEEDSYLQLPQIPRSEVRYLWHSGFWDVPTSGLLLYQGKKYWFQTSEDIVENELAKVIYLVIELSPEELQEEEYWHNLFREKVGTHNDYDEHGKRPVHALRPTYMHHEFYDAYAKRKELNLSDNLVVGWFPL